MDMNKDYRRKENKGCSGNMRAGEEE